MHAGQSTFSLWKRFELVVTMWQVNPWSNRATAQRWNSWNVRPAFRYIFTIVLLLNKNIDTTSKQLQLLLRTDTGIADVELPSGSARTRATGGVTETSYDSSLKSSIYTNSGGNSGRAAIGANIPYYNTVEQQLMLQATIYWQMCVVSHRCISVHTECTN